MSEREFADMADGASPTLFLKRVGNLETVRIQKCKLLVVGGALQGQEYIVDKDLFTIGSGKNNDLVIDDPTISRHHCELHILEDGYTLRDLGSTNGSSVEGVRVREAFLREGSQFKIGHTRIVFCPLRETVDYPLSPDDHFGDMIGHSVPMRRIFHAAQRYAATDSTVLIEGETGTGKEVLAEEIHKHSHRSEKPFVIIDCASLSSELIASELFGHVKGSFTGANTDRVGAFEHAHGGTIFLDEVGELSPELQPKLLRVLEKRQIRRVGSNEVRNVNVRIISATNRRLEREVNAGRFREDLFFRLSVVHMDLPPLRNRTADIRPLLEKFLVEFIGPGALDRVEDIDRIVTTFSRHQWPGNVRELRNLTETASYDQSQTIDLDAFLCMGRMHPRQPRLPHVDATRPFKEVKNELVQHFEKEYITQLLEKHGGNVSQAARTAGIERAYLQRLIRKHSLRGN